MSHDGFRTLIERAKAGDDDAVQALLTSIRPHLMRVSERYFAVDASESTSDMVQETWLHVWRDLDQFEGGADDEETFDGFRAWTARILRNRVFKSRRRVGAQKRPDPKQRIPMSVASDPADSTLSPSGRVRSKEEALRIQQALADLADSEQREVVRLRIFEGCSLKETAERLDLTYDQARERFHRGIQHIGQQLRPFLDPE